MDKLIIENGSNPPRISGSLEISGAKNAALPLLFAGLLTDQLCTYNRIPNLVDIQTTLKLLAHLGVETHYDAVKKIARVQAQQVRQQEAPYDLVRTMRASILVLGPLLARYGHARVSLPGGCSIGARPVNLHLSAMEKMGAHITIENGYIHAECTQLKGADITFDQVSVGATENVVMAACLAKGTTVLRNCALEPEIVDLVDCLRGMGAQIEGNGTSVLTIEGVPSLKGCSHTVVPDRIEAGTYLAAAAITGGNLFLPSFPAHLLTAVLDKFVEAGCVVERSTAGVRLQSALPLKPVSISTTPFPGFPTDMQAQWMAAMLMSNGTSAITENIFENRFMHVSELLRLGAHISIQGKTAIIQGAFANPPHRLSGATVMATDLRASACLVLAGLASQGTTIIRRIYHLDRGYEKMEEKLRICGAHIRREKEE